MLPASPDLVFVFDLDLAAQSPTVPTLVTLRRAFAALCAVTACALIAAPSAVSAAAPASSGPHASAGLRQWGAPVASSSTPRTSPPSWVSRPATAGLHSDVESTNWSGVIESGTEPFTGISANWVVPTVSSSSIDGYSSTWIGIDGVDTSDLIQTGTEQDGPGAYTCGSSDYFAWYELLPAPSVCIGTVTPGDEMHASITQVEAGTWQIVISDETSDQSFDQDFSYSVPGDTAEWIEEAPNYGGQTTLADFGSVQFTQTAVTGGGASPNVTPVDLVDATSGAVVAFPAQDDPAGGTVTIDYGAPVAPSVVSVIPSSGPTSGGTSVTIYGIDFDDVSSVSFGATGAHFTVVDAVTLVATSPPETAGPVNVTVITGFGVSATTSADRFTYVAPKAPPPPIPHGYWLVGADGGIFTFGQAHFYGSTGALHLQRPVVGITPTPDRRGYWLAATDGGIFAFGDAGFHGSVPGLGIAPAGSPGAGPKLAAPIVGMVPSTDGGGYFMVASDGGVFAFGDAHFAGSCGDIGGCAGTAVAVMPDATGKGYWLVTRLGNVYAFGDAHNYGGVPSPASPEVTAAVRTPDGRGYYVLLADGAVYPFGDARPLGAPSSSGVALGGPDPATAIFATSDGGGYFVVTTGGAAYPFGDAVNQGDMNGRHLNAPIIAATGW